jgi:hypothetical protein
MHGRPSLEGEQIAKPAERRSTPWNSCFAGLFFCLRITRRKRGRGDDRERRTGATIRKNAGHADLQQMLEAIGTRPSRLRQSGPPIAQRAV